MHILQGSQGKEKRWACCNIMQSASCSECVPDAQGLLFASGVGEQEIEVVMSAQFDYCPNWKLLPRAMSTEAAFSLKR